MMPARRTSHFEPTPRRLLAALFIALVIAGLMGMHTLSMAEAGPSVTVASADTIAMHGDHVHATAGALGSPADADCGDCGSAGTHHATTMACVLILLVALLLARRALTGSVRTPGSRLVAAFVWSALRLPAPPSLIALSISRT